MVGSAASLAVFTSCVVSPGTMYEALRAIGRPIAMGTMYGMTRHLGNAVMQSAIMQDARNRLRGPVSDGVFRSPASFGRPFRQLARPPSLESLVGSALTTRRKHLKHGRNGHFRPLKWNSCVFPAVRSRCECQSAGVGRSWASDDIINVAVSLSLEVTIGVHTMSPKLTRFGLVVALSLAAGQSVMAQRGGNGNQNTPQENQPVKLTGPAAKKADDLIKGYTARIEKEIDQARKEIERLRTELHELIDVRSEMAATIAEVRVSWRRRGRTCTEPHHRAGGRYRTEHIARRAGTRARESVPSRPLLRPGGRLPKDPTPEQRDQLRRLRRAQS